MPINCFKLHGRDDLQGKFDKLVEAGRNEHEAAREVIVNEHKRLHEDLEKAKGIKKSTYVAPESPSEKIKQIQDEHAENIRKISEEKPTPIPDETKTTITDQPKIDETIPPTAEGKVSEGEGQEMRLTHADTEQIYNEAGLPSRLETPTKHREELAKEVDKMLAKGYDFDKVADEVMAGKRQFEDKDQVAFARKVADLKAKQDGIDINSPEFDKLQNQIEKLSRASDVAGTITARALEARKGFVPVAETISDYVSIEKETLGVEELTTTQKQTIKKEYEDIDKAKKDFEAYMAKREEEFTAKQAEAEFTKTKSATKKTNKTHEDFVTDRKSLKEELAAARKEHEDYLKAQGIQKSGFGSLTTKEAKVIAKIVRSYADEGITKLNEVVQKVFEEVKAVIPNIEERDIRDVIAGAYNEKKKTRNQLAETLVNLRSEQIAIDKYEKLESGEEPKSEPKKIQRNKELKELRDKIKGHDLTKLSQAKEKIKYQIEKVSGQIKTGDFSTPDKTPPVKLDAEGHKLRDNLMKLQQQRDVRMLLQQRQNEGKKESALRHVAEVANVPRTLMTIADFSGLLRQNIFFTVGHPLMTAKALPGMFKSFTSQTVYDRWFADLKDSTRFQIIQDSKLAIADNLSHDLSKREEDFMSTLAEKIPIIGRTLNVGKAKIPGLNIVKGSERSYTMLLNKMRVDMFNNLVSKLEDRGITYENSPKVYKATAEYINNATGRSDFGEHLNLIAPILNSAFFSPRLIASRMNMLTYWAQPRFWKTLPREARVDYFRNWISLLAVGGTILGIASLAGADTEDDPRSSDFGKIKSGDTRWDIWGGAQPYIRVLAQIISGERKSTRSGKMYELNGDDIFGETRAGITADFFRNKLAPIPGSAVDLLSGRTGIGERIVYQWGDAGDKEISINHYVKERVLPMTFTGTAEAMKDQGVKALFTVGVPSAFGVGTQTYSQPPPKPKKGQQRNKQTKPKRNERTQ